MNALELRRRTLGKGVYKNTVEGNPAIAQGSLARRYPGITMQGWTEQDSTTGANLLDLSKISSKTATVDGNDILLSSYTNNLGPAELFFEPGTQYTIQATREAELQNSSGGMRLLNLSGDAKPVIIILDVDKGYGTRTFTTPDDLTGYSLYAYGWNDRPGENYRLTQPMIQKGSVATEYEPYTGGKPSPSPDYPQEIVSAGKYDEGTQKWEYEIAIANEQTDPDKNQTVTLTSDRPLTKWDRLEKRNGQWGWVYKSEEIESYTDESVPGEYFSTTGQLSTGAQVWYETTTETFVPLSEPEQEQMNELYTFRPTTVLSNDCDCNMSLTYKTKKSLEVTT